MIHKTKDNLYVISSGCTWLNGVYKDEKAANYAFRFDDNDLKELQKEKGVITFEDLKQLTKKK